MPVAIRNEVNRRLFENEGGSKILTWLNAQPEVLRILDEYFGEEPVTPQNLSEWRKGGFQDWLKRQEQIEQVKELAEFSMKLGQAAGGNISDGSAAIAGGRIMSMLETATGPDLTKAVFALSALRATDLDKEKIGIRRDTLKQRDRVVTLHEKKFQRDSLKLFLKWAEDKRARDVLESRASNSEKIEQLGQIMFGEDWE